jgi:hypothetical protein
MASSEYWALVADTDFADVDLADTSRPMGSRTIRMDHLKQAMIEHFDSKEGALAKRCADGLRTGKCVPAKLGPPTMPEKVWAPGELFFKS